MNCSTLYFSTNNYAPFLLVLNNNVSCLCYNLQIEKLLLYSPFGHCFTISILPTFNVLFQGAVDKTKDFYIFLQSPVCPSNLSLPMDTKYNLFVIRDILLIKTLQKNTRIIAGLKNSDLAKQGKQYLRDKNYEFLISIGVEK